MNFEFLAKTPALLRAVHRLSSPRGTDPQEQIDMDCRALAVIVEALERGNRLSELVNSPEIEDFIRGLKLEAVHQVEKWGDAHDRGKSAENWFWLVGYLAGKCLRSVITGKREKALHHTISTAAACLNWHSAIKRDTSGSGIGQDDDIRPIEIARFEADGVSAKYGAVASEAVKHLGRHGYGGGIRA